MSATRLLPAALIVTLAASAATSAQQPPRYGPPTTPLPSADPAPPELPPPFEIPPPGAQPPAAEFPPDGPPPAGYPLPEGAVASPWLASCSTGCCGPVGANGPIGTELFLWSGPSIPIGGNFLDDKTQVGWTVVGGGKTLLFNPTFDRAWAFTLGLDYTYLNGRADPNGFGLFGTQVSLRSLHRTDLRLAVGREWWLWGPAYGCPGPNLRVGGDFGGFWGSSHADLNVIGGVPPADYLRRHDVIGGTILGLHSTMELPFRGWLLLLGARAEWKYNRLELLPGTDGDFHDVNMLLTAGLRF